MNTSKKAVQLIANLCKQNGISKVVFSPGSRSAPLVIAFSQIIEIECIVIPDERVAGYFALGMAQQLRETVAVVCTSGTAVLNLAPAVCEAYYQKIPLLVITADRPAGAEERGENQAIVQEDIFKPFAICRTINGDADTKNELEEVQNDILRAIYETKITEGNPQQLNVQLSEPLYEMTDEPMPLLNPADIQYDENYWMKLADIQRVKTIFESFNKKMLIVGMRHCDSQFLSTIKKLNKRNDLVILHENLARLNEQNIVWNIDSCISLLEKRDWKNFVPDIVITLGNQIVSKKIKQFLNKKVKIHWDIAVNDMYGKNKDMFGAIDKIEPANEKQFLEILLQASEETKSDYKKDWLALSKKAETKTEEYLSQVPFSDLKVYETLIDSFPANANIQYGNSSPIRYSNFFRHKKSLTVNANRGTSGIDGCLSTAAGAAHVNNQKTICVIGDISFFYDSNALWNNYLSPDLRIIIINNSGGNIFRLIDGATRMNDFEKFFETKHNLSAKYLASMYDLPYYFCDSLKSLKTILKTFYKPQNNKAAILEIKTDNEISVDVYKKYFSEIQNSNY